MQVYRYTALIFQETGIAAMVLMVVGQQDGSDIVAVDHRTYFFAEVVGTGVYQDRVYKIKIN